MKTQFSFFNICISLAVAFVLCNGISAANLTCYQCKRNINVECSQEDLLPCPPLSDRCVTFITKSEENGFSIQRECGLAPCGFDSMASKGLGMDHCDESFCLSCCKENGCNKSNANVYLPFKILLIITFLLTCIINVAKDFIPPYFGSNKFEK